MDEEGKENSEEKPIDPEIEGSSETDEATGGSAEETGTDEEEETFDEDEKKLFDKLMKKIESAGEMDKELENDMSTLSDRVENVVDSIDRIEHMERSKMERLIYKEGDETHPEEPMETMAPTEVAEEEGPQREESPEGKISDTIPEKEEIPTGEPVKQEEEEREQLGKDRPPSSQDDDISGHIHLYSDSPYAQVKSGEIGFEMEPVTKTYPGEVEPILSNLRRLIYIKIDKGERNSARDLLMMAVNIGINTDYFKENYGPLINEFDIDLDLPDGTQKEEAPIPTGEVEDKETEVLEPELKDEIAQLQKRAQSALQQLDHLIESSSLSQEDFNRVKQLFLESSDLYREKRFHRSQEKSNEAFDIIKNQVSEGIDQQIQDNLYSAKEVLEKYSKEVDEKNEKLVEDLKANLDRAMKAYLTNEYERANLLAKKVLNTILDLNEPEGEEIKKRTSDLQSELRKLTEINILENDIKELEDIMAKANALIGRRDYDSAGKLLDKLEESINNVKKRSEVYSNTKEMDIRISNRMKMLSRSGHDLKDAEKKLKFFRNYFEEGRFDDALVIGKEVESDLETAEKLKKEKESKEILDELETMMVNVDALEDAKALKNRYKSIKESYQKGDFTSFKTNGKDLLEDLGIRMKTLDIERGKKVAGSIIESKRLVNKLRSINFDTVEFERRMRKAKNLIKEHNYMEGLRQLEKIIEEMEREYSQHVESLKDKVNIYRDSIEVIIDRHREEPVMYYIKERKIPILRKMSEGGNYHRALERYRKIETLFDDVILPEDKKDEVETQLTECKFDIYKKKEEGKDISEALSLYTEAQKKFTKGKIVPAEYLNEVSRRYCDKLVSA